MVAAAPVASHEALIGLTAHAHGETLLTRGERAAQTYVELDVSFEIVV